jgi:hypothetical protein
LAAKTYEKIRALVKEKYPVEVKESKHTFIGKVLNLYSRGVSLCLGKTIHMSNSSPRVLMHELTHFEQQYQVGLVKWLFQYFSPRIYYVIFGLMMFFALMGALLLKNFILSAVAIFFLSSAVILLIKPKLLWFRDVNLQMYEAYANAVEIETYRREGYTEETIEQKFIPKQLDSMTGPTYQSMLSRSECETLLRIAIKHVKERKIVPSKGLSYRLYNTLNAIFNK